MPLRHMFQRAVIASMLLGCLAAQAAEVTILDWNILTYNNPGSNEYNALVRIVQAVDPDVIFFEEATNSTGRAAFLSAFAARYPYNFLGAPTYDNPRNQIISAYPLTATGQIFVADPNGGTFERPTIWADLDILPATPEPELRVYATHYKAGYTSRDWTLKLNQATADANHINILLTGDPTARIFYAGDLNCAVGTSPINKLLEPQTTLARLNMRDPYTQSTATYWSSGNTLDHAFYSSTLNGRIISYFIFDTTTFPAGTVPPPALASDSHVASDHLALLTRLDIPEVEAPQDVLINEVFVREAGTTDSHEFIELSGTPGTSLSGLSIVIIEGDDNRQGTVDRVWSLTGQSIGATGYFVMGTAGVNPDMNLGASNVLENGTQSILLVQAASVTPGEDIDTDNDGTPELALGASILDAVAVADDGINNLDKTYYTTFTVGPVGADVPGGIARCPDGRDTSAAADWKILGASMDGSDGFALPTPGASNGNRYGVWDFDGDCDVDGDDVLLFISCVTGPGVAQTEPTCADTDLDGDSDTDQADFGLLQFHLTP